MLSVEFAIEIIPNYTLYRSCLLIYGIAIVRWLSFLFLDDFEGHADVSVAIKSDSTVTITPAQFCVGVVKS